MKFTGLTKFEVDNAVEDRRISEENREYRERKKAAKLRAFTESEPTMKDLMLILKDIQTKLTLLISAVA